MVVTDTVLGRIRASARVVSREGLDTLSFLSMGTQCSVSVAGASVPAVRSYFEALLEWVADFESRYSRFIPESLIGQINAAAGKEWVPIDLETEGILNLCDQLHFLTKGVFDPTALPLIRLWDWKARPPVVPTAEAIAAAKELVGWSKVCRKPGTVFLPRAGMCIDLGGIGKEYAVDFVLLMASRYDLDDVLVDFGHDVRVAGKAPGHPAWHIGLEDPRQPSKCWAGIGLTDAAVASSGDYLRYFDLDGRRYGHIIDPRSGQPVANQCRAVTVIAPNCTIAGILCTTAFILGAKEGLAMIQAYFGAEGALITDDSRYHTRRFYEYVVS